jgi:periplasmic divalent cation tolerance protein
LTKNNKPPILGPGQGTVQGQPQAQGSGIGALSPDCAAIMVYATFPSIEAALAVGRALIEERLAGCINILPGMTSIYAWESKMEEASEAVLIAKTIAGRAEDCIGFIQARHTYDNPAILVLPVVGGSADYLKWLRAGVEHSGAA